MEGNSKTMTVMAVAMCLWFIAACKPGTPSQFIQPGDMEDILVDYHTAKALSYHSRHSSDSLAFYQALYKQAVFQKYGVTEELFDSSMVYYYTHADRFDEICRRVADRLEERALALGATEGEIGKYSQLNNNGDTANIWAEKKSIALMPVPPYNRWDFEIEVDSTFRTGDSFLLQFLCNYIFQDGSKSGVAYLAVAYDNDTIITRNLHFMNSGLSQMNFPAYDDSGIKSIKGFFYLGDGNKRSTTVRLLFLNNIQLIRFHKEKKDEEEIKKDSLPQDSIPRLQLNIDSVRPGDSLRSGDTVVPADTGVASDGVVSRRRMRED